jgi:predicted small secreted protein
MFSDIVSENLDKFVFISDSAGYDFVAVHYSINQPIVGVGAGQWGFDVHNKEGKNIFVYHTGITAYEHQNRTPKLRRLTQNAQKEFFDQFIYSCL